MAEFSIQMVFRQLPHLKKKKEKKQKEGQDWKLRLNLHRKQIPTGMVRLHDTNNKFLGRGSARRSSVILGEPQDYTRTLRAATRLDSETSKGGDSTTCSRM